jgi:RNA polymerase sigma-70 factor (ECF subfamily)
MTAVSAHDHSADLVAGLFDQYQATIFGYTWRLVGNRELAEELTQETFLTVIRKIGFFRAAQAASPENKGGGGLRSWVYRIATNLALDQLRREKRFEVRDFAAGAHPDEVSGRAGPEDEFARAELSENFNLALGALTPAQRMVFLLKEKDGLSLLEISRICGCSANAIKQGLFRARAALRKKLVFE